MTLHHAAGRGEDLHVSDEMSPPEAGVGSRPVAVVTGAAHPVDGGWTVTKEPS